MNRNEQWLARSIGGFGTPQVDIPPPLSPAPTTALYFEAHVTIEPTDDLWQVATLYEAAGQRGFRVADFIMRKDKQADSFVTARGTNYDELRKKCIDMMDILVFHGFKVKRFKIENTLEDTRFPNGYRGANE